MLPYDFTYLINQEDAHDAVFRTADNGASVGMVTTLLAGMSDFWLTMTGNEWAQTRVNRDEKGRSIRQVDLDLHPETVQKALSAFQEVVFSGKLINYSPQMTVILARLADAELMTAVVEAAVSALRTEEKPFAGLPAEEAPGTIRFLAAQIGHIQQMQDWLVETAKELAGGISGNDVSSMMVFRALLQELPQDSCAALGVLQAAAARWPMDVSSFGCWHDGLLRHKKVVCARPGRWLLEDICPIDMTAEARKVVWSVANAILGSPSKALKSAEAFEAFCTRVSQPRPIRHLWEVYCAKPSKAYLMLMKKVHDRQVQLQLLQAEVRISPFLPSNIVQVFEEQGDGLKVFSLKELRDLVLPCMRASRSHPGHIKTVELLVATMQRECELQRKLADAEAALQQQGQGGEGGCKRIRRV